MTHEASRLSSLVPLYVYPHLWISCPQCELVSSTGMFPLIDCRLFDWIFFLWLKHVPQWQYQYQIYVGYVMLCSHLFTQQTDFYIQTSIQTNITQWISIYKLTFAMNENRLTTMKAWKASVLRDVHKCVITPSVCATFKCQLHSVAKQLPAKHTYVLRI